MAEINTILEIVYKTLETSRTKKFKIGLDGNAGIILFYFHFYRYTKIEAYYDKGIDLLEETFQKIDGDYSDTTFSEGISGIAWLIENLVESGFIDIDTDSLFPQYIDEHIHKAMLKDLYYANNNYINGSLGKCLYFIKRYQNTKSHILKKKYKNHITELIFFLEHQKINSFSNQEFVNHKIESDYLNNLVSIINVLRKIFLLEDFNAIVYPLMSYHLKSLVKIIKIGNIHTLETLFCVLESSKILKTSYIDKQQEKVFQQKFLTHMNIPTITYFKYSYISKRLFQDTKDFIYQSIQEKCLTEGLKQMKNENIEELNTGIWDGISGIGLYLILIKDSNIVKTEIYF